MDVNHEQQPKFSGIYQLFPGHSLEDFPTHLTGTAAAQLLTTATVAWHPEVLSDSSSLPQWHRCDGLPANQEQGLFLVPEFCRERLAPEFATDHTIPVGIARLLHYCSHRRPDTMSSLLTKVKARQPSDSSLTTSEKKPTIPCLVDHFFALGYAVLQTQLVTRQLRYTSQLDWERLTAAAMLAAASAVKGDETATQAALTKCFDLLLEEKNRYYPTAAQLLDIAVAAGQPAFDQLAAQCSQPHKINLLVHGEQLAAWNREDEPRARQFWDDCDPQRQCLLGGLWQELPEPLMPLLAWMTQWEQGQLVFRKMLSAPPKVFARLKGNLHAGWPQMLREWNYVGALHSSFSGLSVPRSSFDYVEWQSPSLDAVPTLTRPPLDANAPETYLQLAVRCGEQIDASHQATALLAHPLNHYCPWFQDLRIVCEYGSLLGRWSTADEVLETLYNPGYSDSFGYDDYRDDWLTASCAAAGFSPTRDLRLYWLNGHRLQTIQRLDFITTCLANSPAPPTANQIPMWLQHNDQLAFAWFLGKPPAQPEFPGNLVDFGEMLSNEIQRRVDRIEQKLTPRLRPTSSGAGQLVLTTTPRPRSINGHHLGDMANPVTLPGLGFCTLPTYSTSHGTTSLASIARAASGNQPAMILDHQIRNEFFEVNMDPATGGIRSVHEYHQRGNLLSQRLIAQREQANAAPQWHIQEFKIEALSHRAARATARGELRQMGQTVAAFVQHTEVERGSRLLHIHGSITPLTSLSGSPWQNYLAHQIAWNDETAPRFRAMHDQRQPLNLQRFSAPDLIEIEDTLGRISVLPLGHYWHRQASGRFLDTLLAVPGDSGEIPFQIMLGLNVPHPLAEATNAAHPPLTINSDAGSPARTFRFVELAPANAELVAVSPNWNSEGKFCGAEFWVRETAGIYSDVCLSAPRLLQSAWRLSLGGELIQSLSVREDQVRFEMQPFGLTRIQCQW